MVEYNQEISPKVRKFSYPPALRLVLIAVIGTGFGFVAGWFGFQSSSFPVTAKTTNSAITSRPNFIIFLGDDVGYGDFHVYGHPVQEKTAVDRMAKEGKLFTHLYTPGIVCSPSRAALLTGRYPVRTGVFGKNPVFGVTSSGGLPRRELTIAETLKKSGYKTGMAGKWHLGPYGDSINQMGWAMNEILDHLVNLGIDSRTLALFLSDNGAVRDGCGEEGSNGPFRGGKSTSWEGGVRIPAVAWWPGIIEPGSVGDAVWSTLDIFPTLLDLANINENITTLPIDGKSFAAAMLDAGKNIPETVDRPLFFYCSDMLTAIYAAAYIIGNAIVTEGMAGCTFDNADKLEEYDFRHRCENGFVKQNPPLIFDVEFDVGEHILVHPKSLKYQETISEVSKLVKIHKASIEVVESQMDKPRLPELQPCCDPPLCMCNYEG